MTLIPDTLPKELTDKAFYNPEKLTSDEAHKILVYYRELVYYLTQEAKEAIELRYKSILEKYWKLYTKDF